MGGGLERPRLATGLSVDLQEGGQVPALGDVGGLTEVGTLPLAL